MPNPDNQSKTTPGQSPLRARLLGLLDADESDSRIDLALVDMLAALLIELNPAYAEMARRRITAALEK